MKSNIDLTENQIFSRQQFTMSGFARSIFGTWFHWSIPWSRMTGKEFEAIRTGDKQERESKKLCDEAVSRNYCDRCGVYLVNIPWNRTYGLCRKCSDELGKEVGAMLTYPWGEEASMEPNDALLTLNW